MPFAMVKDEELQECIVQKEEEYQTLEDFGVDILSNS